MSEKPYPAGTRVVLVWVLENGNMSALGWTGTCGAETWDDGFLMQHVIWDYSAEEGVYMEPVCCLRPLCDPDAEPVTEEVKEEAGAD